MSEVPMKRAPGETVAAQILDDIRKEKLLPAERLVILQEKLASVGLDANEWMLLADLSADEG
jgi:hypothetical protein